MIASLVTAYGRPTSSPVGQRLAAGVPGRGDPVVQGAPGRSGGRRRTSGGGGPDPLEAQIPVIVDALAALGIPRLGSDGYEADDVIGTLATAAHGVRAVDVVTGDRDLFQLVDDAHQVRVLYTSRGGAERRRGRRGVPKREVRGAERAPTPTCRFFVATPATGCPGWPGSARRPPRPSSSDGDLAGLRAAVDGGDPAIKGAQRTRLEAASAYLDVAPLVVRVAHDAPAAEGRTRPPHEGRRRAAPQQGGLGVRRGLTSLNRVLSAFGID